MIAVMGSVSQLGDVVDFALLAACVNVDEILNRTPNVQKDDNEIPQNIN
jgi:hypothetical protein